MILFEIPAPGGRAAGELDLEVLGETAWGRQLGSRSSGQRRIWRQEGWADESDVGDMG